MAEMVVICFCFSRTSVNSTSAAEGEDGERHDDGVDGRCLVSIVRRRWSREHGDADEQGDVCPRKQPEEHGQPRVSRIGNRRN